MRTISFFAQLVIFLWLIVVDHTALELDYNDDFIDQYTDLTEYQLIDKYKQNSISLEFPDLILDIPPEEITALHDFYLSTNGQYWTKPKYKESGIEWSFSDVLQSNPCFDNWVGISCVCNVNASEFHWFSYAMYGDYYYQPNAPPDEPLSSDRVTCHISKLYLIDYNVSGTLPDSFGSLTHLTKLHMGFNNIHGPFPTVLFQIQNLSLIEFCRNGLTSLPDDINRLQSVTNLNLYDNDLHGTVPAALGLIPSLAILTLGVTHMHGTIPESLSNLSDLRFLVLSNSSFSGTFPTSIFRKCTQLRYFFIYNNHFSGNHNFDLMFEHNVGSLVYVDVSNNWLTGTIPSRFSGHGESMSRMFLNGNRLTGTFPVEMTALSNLVILDVSDNRISRSLPAAVTRMAGLKWFFLSNNLLTGTVPKNIGNMTGLTRLKLNGNYLTGTLPKSISGLHSLEQIMLHSNHLTGTIPTEDLIALADLQDLLLQNNMFSGHIREPGDPTMLPVTAPDDSIGQSGRRQQAARGALSFVHIDLSNNRLTGTIPEQLFGAAPNLVSFALAKNCIQNSLPESICSSASLQQLMLDGMATGAVCLEARGTRTIGDAWMMSVNRYSDTEVGTIPACLFAMPSLTTLHLSGNGISGTIPSLDRISSVLQDLSLSHNELRGSIPHNLQERPWLNFDLSYNKLTDTLVHKYAPQRDNSSLSLIVNRLSGQLPETFKDAPNISVLQGSLFECDTDGRQLPAHDRDRSNFSCGSNSLNILLYVWAALFGFITLCYRMRSTFFAVTNVTTKRISDNLTWELLRKIKRMFLRVTAFIAGVLLPVYCVFTHFYKSYVYSYAWSTSAVFLSGLVPAVVCGILWFSFLLLLFYRCESVLFRDEFRAQLVNQQIIKKNKLVVENTHVHLLAMVVFSAFNMVAVVIVNIAYVYVDINYNTMINGLAQVGLAFFKLMWNSILLPRIIVYIYRKPVIGGDVSRAHAKIINNQAEMNAIVFETVLNLFNNVVAPCIAIFVANVNCFWNLLRPPPTVTTSYSMPDCFSVTSKNFQCFFWTENTYSTTYAPPFSYSYQCTSTLVTSYVSVFVYMYILDTFVNPILLYGILAVMRFCTAAYNFLYDVEVPYRPTRKNLVFSKNRFVIKFVTNFAVLMTFGVVFPILAVIACVSVVMEIADLQVALSDYFDTDNKLVSRKKEVGEAQERANAKLASPLAVVEMTGIAMDKSTTIIPSETSTTKRSQSLAPSPTNATEEGGERGENFDLEHIFDAEQWRIQEYDLDYAEEEDDDEYKEYEEQRGEEEKEQRGLSRDFSGVSSASAFSPDRLSLERSASRRQYRDSISQRGIDLTKYTYNQRNAEYKLYQVEQKFNKVSYIMSHLLWMLFPLSAVFYAAFLFDMMGDARGFKDAIRISLLMFGLPCAAMIAYELWRYFEVMQTLTKMERQTSGRDSYSRQTSQQFSGQGFDFTGENAFRNSLVSLDGIQRDLPITSSIESPPVTPGGLSRKEGTPNILMVDEGTSGGSMDGSEHSGRSSRSNSRTSPRGSIGGQLTPPLSRRPGDLSPSNSQKNPEFFNANSSPRSQKTTFSARYGDLSTTFDNSPSRVVSGASSKHVVRPSFEFSRHESALIEQFVLADEEEGVDEAERRAKRKSHRVEKVEETAGDFIQQALSLLLK